MVSVNLETMRDLWAQKGAVLHGNQEESQGEGKEGQEIKARDEAEVGSQCDLDENFIQVRT